MNSEVSQFLELATKVQQQLQQHQEENLQLKRENSQLKLENKQLNLVNSQLNNVNSDLQAKLDRLKGMNIGQLLQGMDQQNELQVSSTDQLTNNSMSDLSNTGSFPTMLDQRGNNSLQSITDPRVDGDEDDKLEVVRSSNNSNEVSFDCDICGEKFSTRRRMLDHIDVHNGKRYVCDVENCYAFFVSRSLLSLHKGSHKGLTMAGNEHNKSIRPKSTLSNHLRVDSGNKPYRCNHCNKAFPQKYELSRHLRVHTGEKPYRCTECKKAFSQKSTLSTHLRVHTGEKPYRCNECNKSFSQKFQLSCHLRVHTGEKPYRCNECNKSFSRKFQLSCHLQVHTGGEKPHRCNECNKSFSVRSNLSAHLLIHTGREAVETESQRNTSVLL